MADACGAGIWAKMKLGPFGDQYLRKGLKTGGQTGLVRAMQPDCIFWECSMRLCLKPVAIALCLLAPLPVLAQDDHAARLAAAQEYVAAAVADMDMPRLIEQMWRPMVPQIEASTGKPLSADQLQKIDAVYQDSFTGPLKEILTRQDVVMADNLTLPQIEALRDFYASENGRAVMMKMPDIMAAQQPQIMGLMQDLMPVVMPKLQAIVAGQ
jgi:uncharacterized protein